MKYVLMAIFLLVSFFSYAGKANLPASFVEVEDIDQVLDTTWTGNVEDLYLNLFLAQGLMFEDTYYTYPLENGWGCGVVCKPLEGYNFFSNGSPLQEITIEAEVTNTDDPNRVRYAIISHLNFLEKKSRTTITGYLNSPSIATFQEPCFITFDDCSAISFKNLFPPKDL